MVDRDGQNPDEFEAFLGEVSAESDREATDKSDVLSIEAKVEASLTKYKPDSLIDGFNRERDPDRKASYDAMYAELTELYPERSFESSFHEFVDDKLREAMQSEVTFLAMIKMELAISARYELPIEQMTERKHAAMIGHIIRYGWKLDDPWVDFMNDVLPGQKFEVEHYDDLYLDALLENAQAKENRRELNNAMLEYLESLGIESESNRALTAVQLFRLLVTHENANPDDPNAQADTDELARELNIPSSELYSALERLRKLYRDDTSRE